MIVQTYFVIIQQTYVFVWSQTLFRFEPSNVWCGFVLCCVYYLWFIKFTCDYTRGGWQLLKLPMILVGSGEIQCFFNIWGWNSSNLVMIIAGRGDIYWNYLWFIKFTYDYSREGWNLLKIPMILVGSGEILWFSFDFPGSRQVLSKTSTAAPGPGPGQARARRGGARTTLAVT